MLCPKCKTDCAYRSHRNGLAEHLASLAGFFPYSCHACKHHFLHYRRSTVEKAPATKTPVEREITATRSAANWKRKQRDILLYGLALLLFAAILFYLTREPAPGV
jgi:hypothetical protein